MSPRLRRTFILAIGLACAAVLESGLQAQQPTFRTGVELVQIDAVVVDSAGNPVAGLTQDDFEVFESGTRQTIAAFSTVDIPIERAERPLYSPTAIEPDVATNHGEPGRVYAVVFDDVEPVLALRTRHFLHRFFERHFGANDVAAIMYLGKGANNSQEFTGSRRLLLSALDRFTGGFGTPASADERRSEAQAAMRTFRAITESLARIPGRRKILLLVSTGTGLTDVVDAVDYSGGTMSIAMEDAHLGLQAASRGNVAIYPINPQGLQSDGGGGDVESGPTVEALQGATAARLAARSNLSMIADTTGGFVVANRNTYDEAFTQIVRENSSYYVLGYYPTRERRDGRFVRVDVRVKRPGLTVRSRTGYATPTSRTRASTPTQRFKELSLATSEAFANPLPATGVPLAVFAAPFKGVDDEALVSVVIGINPDGLRLVEKDGTFTGSLELGTGAASDKGKLIEGQYHVATLALRPDTMARARLDGVQVAATMRLRPGRYQIRVAAGNGLGRSGSVVYDIDVPDFSKGPLTMSGVALSSQVAGRLITLSHPKGGKVEDLVPVPPTSARTFDADDTLTLFAEIYDNVRTPHTVDISATLRADDGVVVRTVSEQRSSAELKGTSGGYGFRPEIPLQDTPPGLYVIHVEARSTAGARPTVSRDVQIRIR